MQVCVYTWVSKCTCISYLCPLRNWKQEAQVATSIPSTQILVLNAILQQTEPVFLEKRVVSRAEKLQHEPRAFHSARK